MTSNPQDLRELLREARDDLLGWVSSDLPIDSSAAKRTLELIYRIDAALAQPPDAKPVAWLHRGKDGELTVPSLQCRFSNEDPSEFFPVYSAPQPPAGKGDQVCCGKFRDCSIPCVPRAEHWKELALNASSEELAALGDAIPREIHERLVRDAKRGRWILHNVGLVNDWAIRDWNPESGITLIAYLKNRVDAAVASEHERGG